MSLIPFAPFALADDLEAKRLQRPKNLRFRRISQEFYPVMSEASVTKASITSSCSSKRLSQMFQ
jgi:hypothetical protein